MCPTHSISKSSKSASRGTLLTSTVATGLSLVVLLASVRAEGAAATGYLATEACTEQESWVIGRGVPQTWGELFVGLVQSKSNALESFGRAYQMKTKLKTPES